MFYWNENVSDSLADELVKLIIEKEKAESGIDISKMRPAGRAKSLRETLQRFRDKWFIQYNDENGYTYSASID